MQRSESVEECLLVGAGKDAAPGDGGAVGTTNPLARSLEKGAGRKAASVSAGQSPWSPHKSGEERNQTPPANAGLFPGATPDRIVPPLVIPIPFASVNGHSR